jgi:SAM-dependent methyltransferase
MKSIRSLKKLLLSISYYSKNYFLSVEKKLKSPTNNKILSIKMSSFYDIHATDFSKSRFRIWPGVKNFLDSLPPNSKVLDIGCGNGKNMKYREDLQMFGVEHSHALTDICLKQDLRVIHGDAREIPFKDNSFDAIIMIAVIHHINPDEHHKVLSEIQRILVPGGKCLITNWAVEQPENAKRQFHKGLNMVTWKGKETVPLPYWVMDKNLAVEFTNNIPSGLKFMNLEWDAGNWNFTLQKII